MCGICGIVGGGRPQGVDEHVIRRMCRAIAHRGPDDEGVFVDGAVGLGIRRLSIIDPEGGNQPIVSEDGSVVLVFNGEIYNFRELREELVGNGHRFATAADTEVLVHGYEEFGPDVVHRLRGMFGFALWDAREEQLLLAVDRFGIKPIYWALTSGQLVFGSEMSSVLASGVVPRSLDDAALAEFLSLGFVPAPASILEGVHKLDPGTRLVWRRDSEPVLDRYWEPPHAHAGSPVIAEDLRSALLAQLRDAVRSHLVSDVPIGAFLSGGVDSSIVVALMAEATPEPVKTFSIGFDDPAHDELEKARIVARQYGTDHHELVVDPGAVDEVLPALASHFGEPFADSSALPTYYVSGLAAESVKVALSGDGGDEMFIGYTTFQGVDLARRLEPVPDVARRSLARGPALVPRLPSAAWNDRLGRWGKRLHDSLAGAEGAYRSKLSIVAPDVLSQVLSRELQERLATRNPFRRLDQSLAMNANGADPLERFLHANLEVTLPSDMLVKVDRMSMARSLEVRVPLLDHVLAEFALAIPVRQRFPRWRLKGLLRDSVTGLLPESILRQRKHGFTVPLSRWFRGDLTAFARDILLDDVTRRRGFLDSDGVQAALAKHATGARDMGGAVWSLVVLELWCREVLDA